VTWDGIYISSSLIVLPFSLKESNYLVPLKMASQRPKVLVVLIFTIVMYYIILQVVAMQRVAILYHHFMLGAMELIALKKLVSTLRNRSIWKHERLSGYMQQHLFGEYTEKMFRACSRLDYDTFNYLVSIVAPSLQKQDTHMHDYINVEKCVALPLARLGRGNSLMSCREPFGT
jgi:hypothetical protein